MDVYSPNALGGALDDVTVSTLACAVVCGAANNQLVHGRTAADLAARGILYMPDFLVNAGGVIQVADELRGFDDARAQARATLIFETSREVLARAAANGELPATAADRLAEERIAEGPWVRAALPRPGRCQHPRRLGTLVPRDRRSAPPTGSDVTVHRGNAPEQGGRAMGRGRAKAKQTKVARDLKYNSGAMDLNRLRADLIHEDGSEVDPELLAKYEDLRRGRARTAVLRR